MKQNKLKVNNHLLPHLITKNWKQKKGKLFDKDTNESRNIEDLDFSEKYYYSLGKKDDTLENRISKFENVITPILKKVNTAIESVELSGKEVELLKLFCVLTACRQDNTSTLIKSDESGIYTDNNYLFGVPSIKTQEEAVKTTSGIMDEFEKINKLPKNAVFKNWNQIIDPGENGSFYTLGQHLVILRNEDRTNIISDICAIIECTMDSDYLFTYVPISPKTSLALVKSKYYDNPGEYIGTLKRFGNKYGDGRPDPFLSAIFEEREYILFNSYSFVRSAVHIKEEYFKIKEYSKVKVKIQPMIKNEIRQFNSIICEDGKKILYTNKEEFDFALKNKLNSRDITVGFNMMNDSEVWLGEIVEVTIDRKIGDTHPKFKDIIYPINYGYIKDTVAGDGEEQDAYIIGVEKSLESFSGEVIAIIQRLDDNEDKLVVAEIGKDFSDEEIIKATHFQEQYFRIKIIR